MAVGYKEVRGKLGFFGKVCRVLFWGWQALMVYWFLQYTHDVAPVVQSAITEAEKAGAGIGVGFAWAMILFFWLAGSVILGLFVLFTRGPKMLVPLDPQSDA